MQVIVFTARADAENSTLLVLPDSPEAIIPSDFKVDWEYYAAVKTSDRLFHGVDAATIKDEIAANGFAIVSAQEPNMKKPAPGGLG
jgi:hypothetical protein